MEILITKIARHLKSRNWKLTTAESCTGGGVAYHLTNLSGSSDWFERGFVTYSNLAKEEMLGVSTTTLKQFGAVSQETAHAMAEGALKHSPAQISVSITGIAGPTGGTTEKPVGTVWFGWAGIDFETTTKLEKLTGNREEIREKAIQIALEGLLRQLSD
jgi:nicotinamide-nucleotide amidase